MANGTQTLGPITSGTKILSGTRAVITGRSRNLINNAHRNAKNALRHTEFDFDVAPDTEITVKHNEMFPKKVFNRTAIKNSSLKILKESMYQSPYQMGDGSTMVRNVANPYNPSIKSSSIVDQKARYKSQNDIYPKVKVDNSIMSSRVRKVRTYLYKSNGMPTASKIQNQPIQPVNPI